MTDTTNVANTNGIAIASLVVGIVSVLTGLFFIGGLFGIAAIILGIIALKKHSSRPMATTGIVLGSIGLVVSTVSIILAVISIPIYQKEQNDIARKTQVGMIVREINSYEATNGTLPDPQMVSDSLKTSKLDIVTSGEPTTSTAVYKAGITCNGTQNLTAFSITTLLESGEKYCKD